MPGKTFIDTNILVYIYSSIPEQQKKTLELFNRLDSAYISSQVITEFCNIMIKKFKIKNRDLIIAIDDFQKNFNIIPVNNDMVLKALEINDKYKYSFYDSLIISAAIVGGCSILYTEDMQNGQIIENSLKIINPFI